MEPQSAADNLQVIRTLMERASVYRRALTPILLWCGLLGVAGAAAHLPRLMIEIAGWPWIFSQMRQQRPQSTQRL